MNLIFEIINFLRVLWKKLKGELLFEQKYEIDDTNKTKKG